ARRPRKPGRRRGGLDGAAVGVRASIEDSIERLLFAERVVKAGRVHRAPAPARAIGAARRFEKAERVGERVGEQRRAIYAAQPFALVVLQDLDRDERRTI